MERYMWSLEGKKYSEAGTFEFRRGERVRMILVNDTMMEHPIHLHLTEFCWFNTCAINFRQKDRTSFTIAIRRSIVRSASHWGATPARSQGRVCAGPAHLGARRAGDHPVVRAPHLRPQQRPQKLPAGPRGDELLESL